MIRLLLVLVLLLVLAWVAAGSWLFVVHHGDKPFGADAVVVLAGTKQRLPVGLELMRRGFAPILVVSRSHSPTQLETETCRGPHRYRVDGTAVDALSLQRIRRPATRVTCWRRGTRRHGRRRWASIPHSNGGGCGSAT